MKRMALRKYAGKELLKKYSFCQALVVEEEGQTCGIKGKG